MANKRFNSQITNLNQSSGSKGPKGPSLPGTGSFQAKGSGPSLPSQGVIKASGSGPNLPATGVMKSSSSDRGATAPMATITAPKRGPSLPAQGSISAPSAGVKPVGAGNPDLSMNVRHPPWPGLPGKSGPDRSNGSPEEKVYAYAQGLRGGTEAKDADD